MANRFRGEVKASTGHVLVLDYNALAEFEDVVGRPAFEVIGGFEKGSARVADLRALVYACLRRNHAETTLADAGDILSEDPTVWTRVLVAASPPAESVPSEAKGRQKKAG